MFVTLMTKAFANEGVVLVGRPYAYVQGCGVGLVVEGGGGSEAAVDVDGEEVVVLGAVAVGEG